MTNSQNPLGFTLSAEKKAQVVALLTRHNVTLIEDDVYSELYFGREKPLPAKARDKQDMTLHCSSFSASGGWFSYWLGGGGKTCAPYSAVAADEYVIHQFSHAAGAGGLPATKRYDAHLRRLRRTLAERKQQARQSLLRHMPAGVKINHNDSGYFYGWNCLNSWMRGG